MGGHLNLDGGTINLDGGMPTLDGGTRPPYNLSTGYRSPLSIKPGKKNSKVCGCGITKNYRKLAVADHPLLFFGLCGRKIEFKFAVPSTAKKLFNCSARGQRNVVLDEQFL